MHRVECGEHGSQDETYVCKHLVSSLKTQQVVGFYWASEPPVVRLVLRAELGLCKAGRANHRRMLHH